MPTGTCVALPGANGAGKMVTGLAAPRAGRVAVGGGEPGRVVAAGLHLAEGTVRNYLSSAIARTGGRNRVGAAHLATERGWL